MKRYVEGHVYGNIKHEVSKPSFFVLWCAEYHLDGAHGLSCAISALTGQIILSTYSGGLMSLQ